MARKRATPKPPADVPASLPFPDVRPEDLQRMVGGIASMVDSFRIKRAVLQRASVVADPDGLVDAGPYMLEMDPPETEYDLDPATARLRVVCHCRLVAERATPTGRRRKAASAPVLTVDASFRLDYEIDDVLVAAVDETLLNVFLDVAVSHAWPYWREYVRDASTRAGLPVIDVPFDVEF